MRIKIYNGLKGKQGRIEHSSLFQRKMGGFLLGFTMGSTVHKEFRGLLWDYGFESATPMFNAITGFDGFVL